MTYSPNFITKKFISDIATDGRLYEAIEKIKTLSDERLSELPKLTKLSTWELVLEEVLDTDHEIEYYYKFIHELYSRGITDKTINDMRKVAWETAGWYNFEMMAWDWCTLTVEDMYTGLKDRLERKNISKEQFDHLKEQIEKHNT